MICSLSSRPACISASGQGFSITQAAGGSPMSFSRPTLHEPAVVLDCGVTHGIQGDAPHRDDLIRIAPGVVLCLSGFGVICQSWGGLLAGIRIGADHSSSQFRDANQGAMLFTCRISLFADVNDFSEMDEYVRQVRQLKPLEGTTAAFLPGGIEAEHERAYPRDGIPLSEEHQGALEKMAAELGIAVPWR